jgi:8-oxo-dGTP diphosphatase
MWEHAEGTGGTSIAEPIAIERDAVEPARRSPGQGGLVGLGATPSLDLRVVLFTVAEGRLRVALHQRGGVIGLPRGAPAPAEPLDATARRIVREATGLREQYLEQLYTLSVQEPSGWTVIIAHLALISSGREAAPTFDGAWHDVARLPELTAADRMVLDYAVLRLRAKLGYTTIAFHLLPPTFTLSELQGAYEAILNRPLDKRNFRRRVIAAEMLAPTDAKRREGSHRPALLYRFRAAHDRETYLTPAWAEGA